MRAFIKSSIPPIIYNCSHCAASSTLTPLLRDSLSKSTKGVALRLRMNRNLFSTSGLRFASIINSCVVSLICNLICFGSLYYSIHLPVTIEAIEKNADLRPSGKAEDNKIFIEFDSPSDNLMNKLESYSQDTCRKVRGEFRARRRIRSVRVRDLLKSLKMSERQFERRFLRAVGVSPHRYIRLMRFKEVIRM